MSRSGYIDDCDDQWRHICYRGAVASAIRGKRGQQLFRDLLAALDAMPVKELVAHELVRDGSYCTLGVLGAARNIPLAEIDPEDSEQVANAFDIAESLAREIVYMNDEWAVDEHKWVSVEICGPVRPGYPDWGSHTKNVLVYNDNHKSERWQKMREWIAKQIREQAQ